MKLMASCYYENIYSPVPLYVYTQNKSALHVILMINWCCFIKPAPLKINIETIESY